MEEAKNVKQITKEDRFLTLQSSVDYPIPDSKCFGGYFYV